MESVFFLLIFVSLALFIVGLFSPKNSLFWYNQERTKKKSALIYLAVFIISFALFGVLGEDPDYYKKGNDYYSKQNYEKALSAFNRVKPEDSNYVNAINKIKELQPIVDSLNAEKQLTKKGNNKEINTPQKKAPLRLTDEEYISFYTAKFDSIQLTKRFEESPLYGKYAEELNFVLFEMSDIDSLYNIFSNKQIKSIYDKQLKKWDQAVSDYLKYGEPDEDLIWINAASKTALKSYLNDPKFEVVKEKYYLKQTKTGYDYKLQIRAKNKFNAWVLKEITFSLEYNPFDKMYVVAKIKE